MKIRVWIRGIAVDGNVVYRDNYGAIVNVHGRSMYVMLRRVPYRSCYNRGPIRTMIVK